MDKNLVLVSCAIVYKNTRGGKRWFIVRQTEESDWEIPKVAVRKTESSVKAEIRMMGEQGGMTIQVLEEVGRAGGVTTINGKTLPQRHIFYLIVLKYHEGEAIGFEKSWWLEYAKAVRQLVSKRDRAMLRLARKVLKNWEKTKEKNKRKMISSLDA